MKDDLISRHEVLALPKNITRNMRGEIVEETIDVAAIKRLPPVQPGWIPCSEEPDTNRSVFIARGHDDMVSVCIGYYDHDYKQWYEERNWFAKCLYDGLYWCEMPPLPTPYREGGQDDSD